MHKITALRDATAKAGDTTITLAARRKSVVEAGQALVAELRGLTREPTADETAVLAEAAAALEALDAKIEKADESADTMTKMAAGQRSDDGNRGRLNFKSVGAAREIASKMADPSGVKAIVSSGDAVTGVPLDATIYEQGRVGTTALDLIPFKTRSPRYSYFRQTQRANRAAPVSPGQLKPTSNYGLTNIDGKLEVIAHVADPINEYDLEDNRSLEAFVQLELLYGLNLAVEAQVLSGDGEPTAIGQNLTGILETPGVQQIAYSVDRTVSVRKALTAIEKSGLAATSIIVSPDDWEALELSRRETGDPDLGSALPVERAAQRLWGLKVAVSTQLVTGQAIVFDPSALAVVGDGRVKTQWGTITDDFGRNQIRPRTEGRFGLDVYRPMGIAVVDLTA